MSNLKSCTHIKVSGVRCGSPPLRGEQFCYFHQRMLRTVKDPASRIHHHALLEDEESIQASLMEVVNALLRGTIELKRAELILRALNTAVRNIRRVKFGVQKSEMVTELPDYPTPPLEQIDEDAAAAVARATKRAAAERAAYLAAPRVAAVNATAKVLCDAEVTARKPSASVKEARTSAKTQAPANARKEAPRSSKTEAPQERKSPLHSLPQAKPKGASAG